MGTPTVRSGADTMNMIRSTSMTSTMGVTLISDRAGLRRCRRLCVGAAMPAFITMRVPLCPLVDLPREDGGKFVRVWLRPLSLLVHVHGTIHIRNGERFGGDGPG